MKTTVTWIGCFCLTLLASCIVIGIKSDDEITLSPEISEATIAALLAFDGNVDDQSAYGINGIPVGVRFRKGKQGMGLYLSGRTSSYVYYTDREHFHIPEPRVEAWIKMEGLAPSNTIVSENTQGADDDAKGFILDIEEGRPRFVIGDDTRDWKAVIGSTDLRLNTWYHVVGMYRNSYLKVFVNGKLDSLINVGPINISYVPKRRTGPSPSVLYVGIRHSAHESPPTYAEDLMYPFHGIIDEVRIYNRGLTDSEVRALYRYSTGRN